MNMLEEYLNARTKIFKYFGYVEDWVSIPFDFQDDKYWHLTGEGSGDEVKFWDELSSVGTEDTYSNEIYTQRFLPKWVYRGKDYTMVVVDTQVDGNKFLQVFSNKLELTESEINKKG